MPTITAALAADLFYNKDGTAFDGWTRIASVEDDESRWSRNYTLVLQDADGAFWGLLYSVGKTEEQENDFPWQAVDAGETLDPFRLYPHTITKVVYRTKPAKVPA